MSRTRHILAVVTVTAVLCADHVIAATPMPKPEMAEAAARLVQRLSQAFPRSVRGVIRMADRSPQGPAHPLPASVRPVALVLRHGSLSPFQFRLPPPARV